MDKGEKRVVRYITDRLTDFYLLVHAKLYKFVRPHGHHAGTNVRKSCRFEKMLQNECFVAKVGLNAAENEPRKVSCMLRAREPWFGIVFVSGQQS